KHRPGHARLRVPGHRQLRPVGGRPDVAAVELDEVALGILQILADPEPQASRALGDGVLAEGGQAGEGARARTTGWRVGYLPGRRVVAARAAGRRRSGPRGPPVAARASLPDVPGGLQLALPVA